MRTLGAASIQFGLIVIAGAALWTCAAHLPFETAPAWYTQDSGPHTTSKGPLFYGIGVADRSGPPTLMRVTADNRARNEMAAVLQRYIADLVHASAQASLRPEDEREQIAGRLLRSSMQRALITDHWSDGSSGRLFALCELPLDVFKQVVRDDAALDRALRAELLSETDVVHVNLR